MKYGVLRNGERTSVEDWAYLLWINGLMKDEALKAYLDRIVWWM